ncbi:MAG TPA: serine/threonine-protein kinase [Isosphaeraceae bacterium]|nr:serine/threonine-protein kinase [Isosphaeraceae bacterium]
MSESGIFKAAVKLPPDRRAAYLDQACGSDAELRGEIESLLHAHDSSGSFLENVPAGPDPTEDYPPIAERPGTVIGPYKLMEQIGEGGFGLVFVAEQQHPIRRKVALKIIKPGMDTRDIIARFEAERQALALMDHSNIARVFDAGTTESGRPYFVMELVRGISIVEYCDSRQLTTRDRLELFLSVCHAVQHAHSKGIIHRDLKPSNILVAPHDGVPVVKVIDFGVAKAIGQQLTDKTIYTRFAQMIRTPLYMSPEQVELNALDVDIRSDVYSLGVLLYEHLTGTTPFDRQRLATASFDEMRRIIKEEEPPTPSRRLSSARELATIATARQTEPAKLAKLVRGDLDWIVMKCLEKARERRYETTSGLARDIQRYLADEPVEARPPSAAYRLGKFVKRHRTAVLAASLVLLALALGAVASAVFALRERDARQRATHQAHVAEESLFLLEDALARADPNSESNRDITLRAAVDRMTEKLNTGELKSRIKTPEINARVRIALGMIYFNLGDYGRSRDLFAEAHRIAREQLGETDPMAMTALDQLGKAHMYLEEFADAERVLLRAYALQQKVLGPEHEDTLHTYAKLGDLYQHMGQSERAVEIAEAVLRLRRRIWGDEYTFTLVSMNNLGVMYRDLGRPGDALAMFQEVERIERGTLGEDHPKTLGAGHNIALACADLGRQEEALRRFTECLGRTRKILGDDHFSTLQTEYCIATVLYSLGRYEESRSRSESILRRLGTSLARDHSFRGKVLLNLGKCLAATGEYPEAERTLREARAILLKKLGPGHRSSREAAKAFDDILQRIPGAALLHRNGLVPAVLPASTERGERTPGVPEEPGRSCRFLRELPARDTGITTPGLDGALVRRGAKTTSERGGAARSDEERG